MTTADRIALTTVRDHAGDCADDRDAPPNLTEAKQRVREYYGDHVDADGRHRLGPDSAWSRATAAVVDEATAYLMQRLDQGVTAPAVVLDVDDTALSTYEFLANTEFGTRRNREVLPAIEPTLRLARRAHARGAALFLITERLLERHDETTDNLVGVGYPLPTGLFLRVRTPPFPAYLPAPDCDSAAFKSATRAHIEQRGYTIVVNVGDQHSDLRGGHAERGFKLPNPMYRVP